MFVIELCGGKVREADLGIEVEMEGRNLYISAPGWQSKNDGSLRGRPDAVEYVSSPFKEEHLGGRLFSLKRELDRDSTLRPSKRCGVHVHVNCQTMTIQEVVDASTIYYMLEPALLPHCGDFRKGNLFCLSPLDTGEVVHYLIKSKENARFDGIRTNSFKYSSLNLETLWKFGTLEFRAMQTPTDVLLIAPWAKTVLSIVRWGHSPKALLDLIQTNGWEAAFITVMGEELAHKYISPEILPVLEDNLYSLLPLIYTEWDSASLEKVTRRKTRRLRTTVPTSEDIPRQPRQRRDEFVEMAVRAASNTSQASPIPRWSTASVSPRNEEEGDF